MKEYRGYTDVTNLVGIEAEYFCIKDGKAIVVPQYLDRDGFHVLGEIRGAPGDSVADVAGNFTRALIEVKTRINNEYEVCMTDMQRIPLGVYKEAIKSMRHGKSKEHGKIKNAYGTDISEFSDQIVQNGKIQGVNASCGLHIHFSSGIKQETTVKEPQYENVRLPIEVAGSRTTLDLYRKRGYIDKVTYVCEVSQLTRPVIEWIVKQMDDKFWDRFAPDKDKRTKYRQKGFYELKPYGFEYRSLPANKDTIDAIPEIVTFAFQLLNDLND